MTWSTKLASLVVVISAVLISTSSLLGQSTEDFDIYLLDVKKRVVKRVSSIPNAGEFNPSFSNNGKSVVHDVVTSTSHDLYLTAVRSGTSAPLLGGDGGNDGAWSPNGKLIAFDRDPVGNPSVYIVPAGGGSRVLIRGNAIDPAWSNNSKRLVFVDVTDGSVRTIDLNGVSETTVASFGLNPAWSRNGKYIAYSDGNNLFRVRVNRAGVAQGSPQQLTNDGPLTFNSQPSWSNNSKTIVFHSNRGGDFDIWTIPASGGTATRLTGLAGKNDFDPSYSKNGRVVAYAGYTSSLPKQTASNKILVPSGFSLEQNHPNPFNPETEIRFHLPETGQVFLRIFNMLGEEIRTLSDRQYESGTHSVLWDGKDKYGNAVSSGIYLYQLQAGTFSQIRKMNLLR